MTTTNKQHRLGIIMAGVTGRMGCNQHLIRSIQAIREEGGLPLSEDETIWPEPVLVGRNATKLSRLAEEQGGLDWTTDLESVLSDERYPVYFDALSTQLRYENVKKAIAAGKHIYCEKPLAADSKEALDLTRLGAEAKVKTGVVQDKLWLPGICKLRYLIDSGFFGRILSVRGEFGYWVFDGQHRPAQRPAWNYRQEEGGGIILDMLAHWRYLIDNLFGRVTSVSCLGAVHLDQRWERPGQPYEADAEDAAYATLQTDQGIICHFNSSWCVRVRRDDLLTVQVDGTKGSAVAGLRQCWVQPDASTPAPVWSPDIPNPIDFKGGWQEVPDTSFYPNAFRAEWELFLRHVVADTEFTWDFGEGVKGVQLAELAHQSWQERRWVDVPDTSQID